MGFQCSVDDISFEWDFHAGAIDSDRIVTRAVHPHTSPRLVRNGPGLVFNNVITLPASSSAIFTSVEHYQRYQRRLSSWHQPVLGHYTIQY